MEFLNYWNLKEKPFENTGDPKFFYYSPNHKEAMVRIVYVIKNNKAGALLAGDYGTGKTTIAKELLAEIEESGKYRSVYISNPLLSARELIEEIAIQLGIDDSKASRPKLRRMIEEKLKSMRGDGKHTIIIVDEAHLINRKEVLEEIRLLMNTQYRNSFLATAVMMGQLELRDIINAMPQFKQRFAICYVLKHLDESETSKYVDHRMSIAGGRENIFSEDAKKMIFSYSNGRPRQVNNICDMALLVGSMRRVSCIDPDIVKDVVKDLGEDGV
ncbi:MAG: AAA family ATPase [Candidatus Omnitrophica bacterium]|nr:AAA family ATPase [Candidatus Omnitrophota bacterium]